MSLVKWPSPLSSSLSPIGSVRFSASFRSLLLPSACWFSAAPAHLMLLTHTRITSHAHKTFAPQSVCQFQSGRRSRRHCLTLSARGSDEHHNFTRTIIIKQNTRQIGTLCGGRFATVSLTVAFAFAFVVVAVVVGVLSNVRFMQIQV